MDAAARHRWPYPVICPANLTTERCHGLWIVVPPGTIAV
jgi:hypothetical protein